MKKPHLSSNHVHSKLLDYTLGRLGSDLDCEIEMHLLACDSCFAALVAQVVVGSLAEIAPIPA